MLSACLSSCSWSKIHDRVYLLYFAVHAALTAAYLANSIEPSRFSWLPTLVQGYLMAMIVGPTRSFVGIPQASGSPLVAFILRAQVLIRYFYCIWVLSKGKTHLYQYIIIFAVQLDERTVGNLKLDLLVRVRYSNPLPPPPCPPKLLELPIDPLRYAKPEFLQNIASDVPLPMIVDAECGMPLDLAKWECLWEDDGDDSALNPKPEGAHRLDPKDAFLLGDPASGGAYTNGHSTPGSSIQLPSHVSWLRKTEYLTGSASVQRAAPQEPKFAAAAASTDVSRAAQIKDIEASFAACNENFDLSTVVHPNKPGVTAVESYEILPDADIWANAYDLFRFSERPGERPIDTYDPRLDCAILRPMESDGDHFLAYYITQDDESAIKFKEKRASLSPYEIPDEDEETVFHWARDYETVKIEQEVPNEFLLVIDDGSQDDPLEDLKPQQLRRSKAAYYKNIERKMILKKKRANMQEEYEDKWEVIRVTHSPMSKEEEEEREELMVEVTDPMYLRRDADAEGEVEVDDGTHTMIAVS
ncbi:hypothetical protein ONZ45_g4616 [Pleurotus djamor]|nr:hypothetical protein ONZ45_g4616 [Pleurotus djamor]